MRNFHNTRHTKFHTYEWYTPEKYVLLVKQVLGEITTDPASSEEANKTVRAKTFYDISTDGLLHSWHGKIFLNPPYRRFFVTSFTEKLISEYNKKNVSEAIVLVNNATDTQWFQYLCSNAHCLCFPKERIKFVNENISYSRCTFQGQTFVYLGPNTNKFQSVFSPYGLIAQILKRDLWH